jgi:hypothetical protein
MLKKWERLYILDTKKGETAKSQNTKDKSEALQKWIKDNKNQYSFEIIGWILEFKYPNWMINKKDKYIYENDWDWENIFL